MDISTKVDPFGTSVIIDGITEDTDREEAVVDIFLVCEDVGIDLDEDDAEHIFNKALLADGRQTIFRCADDLVGC